jgi:hypothetical protein
MENQTLKTRLEGVSAISISMAKSGHFVELRNEIIAATSWCPEEYLVATRMYIVRNGITEVPKCTCGNLCGVYKQDYQLGFRQYCSDNCSKNNRKSKKFPELKSYEWMYQKRITERLSWDTIAELLGVSAPCIKENCAKLGIPMEKYVWHQSATPEQKKQRASNITKNSIDSEAYDKLYNTDAIKVMYYDKGMSIAAIAKELNVAAGTVETAAKSIGLHLEERSYHIHKSKSELDMLEFVRTMFPDAISGYRLNGYQSKEVDIYVKELNIGIDFHGCTMHSDKFGKPNLYHRDKLNEFVAAGVRYVQIWEDEWKFNCGVVQQFIKNLLGVSEKRIGARSTKVVELTQSEYSKFLDANHMQGKATSKIRYGLVRGNMILAVMGFSKRPSNTEGVGYMLDRFANTNVTGAFGKLLAKFKAHYNTDIYSFADLQIVDRTNNIYLKNGFEEVKVLAPDYKYYHSSRTKVRKHKFGFRKANFKKMGFDIEGKTESQLAKEANIDRCYDSGKILYVLKQ